jgi:hypothetical protein
MADPAWKRNTQGDLKFKYPSFIEENPPQQLADKPPAKPEGKKPERYAAPPPAARKEPSPAFTPPRGSGLPLPTPPRSGGGVFSCCCGNRTAREEFHHQVVSVTLTKLEKIAATQTALQQQQDAMAQQLVAATSRLDRIIGGNAEVAQMLRTDRAAQRSTQAAPAPAPTSRAPPAASRGAAEQRWNDPAPSRRAPSSKGSDDGGVVSDWEAIERRASGLHDSLPGNVPAADGHYGEPAPEPAPDHAAVVPYSEDATLSEWEKIEARVNAGADDAKHKASAFDPSNPRFSILAAPPSNALALTDRAP